MLKKNQKPCQHCFSEPAPVCGLSQWRLYTNHKGIRNPPLSAWQHVFSCPFALHRRSSSPCYGCQWATWNPEKYRCTNVVITNSCMFLLRGEESDLTLQSSVATDVDTGHSGRLTIQCVGLAILWAKDATLGHLSVSLWRTQFQPGDICG